MKTTVLLALLIAIVGRFMADEVKAWAGWLHKRLRLMAVAKLPLRCRERYDEEWEGGLEEIPGEIYKLIYSVGLIGAALGIRNAARKGAADSKTIHILAESLMRRVVLLEQRRSRILEDINSSRSLGDIIDHITEMVSYMLNGAPCWCQVNEGPLFGHRPAAETGLRIISGEIHSRTGLLLGTLYAALDSIEENEKDEEEALTAGVRLATLSIETRKLYSDLVHRSEFDQLTDLHNRFSIDRHLEEFIEKARETESTFGLIYIDLDDFNLVNDRHGHHVSDLYLKGVSMRMKQQLRKGYILGRFGGDEFVVLASVKSGRSEVEECAQRLRSCFDAPFNLEGSVIHGAASVGIAIYPTDGITADSLLTTADAAMYSVKKSHHLLGPQSSGTND